MAIAAALNRRSPRAALAFATTQARFAEGSTRVASIITVDVVCSLDMLVNPRPVRYVDVAMSSQAPARTFRALYDAEIGYVGRVLRRFGVEARHLEDVVQEVFVVVYKRHADFDPARPIRPWLCGIAFRVASQWRRRPIQRNEVLQTGDEPHQPPSSSSRDATDRRLIAHETVLRGLSALRFEQRAVVVLCDLEGHSAVEAAAILHIPTGTVYSRLHEARRLFAVALGAGGSR
jgi:RNA polymerase sigma-70 factor (ECF subfamily)